MFPSEEGKCSFYISSADIAEINTEILQILLSWRFACKHLPAVQSCHHLVALQPKIVVVIFSKWGAVGDVTSSMYQAASVVWVCSRLIIYVSISFDNLAHERSGDFSHALPPSLPVPYDHCNVLQGHCWASFPCWKCSGAWGINLKKRIRSIRKHAPNAFKQTISMVAVQCSKCGSAWMHLSLVYLVAKPTRFNALIQQNHFLLYVSAFSGPKCG